MDEIMEAERFDVELEKILAGRPIAADVDPELAKDLAFAARLATLDFKDESRAKGAAKTKILAKAGEHRLRALLRNAGVRPAVLAACSFLLIAGLAPLWLKRMMPTMFNNVQQMITGAAGSMGDATGNVSLFAPGASPYGSGSAATGSSLNYLGPSKFGSLSSGLAGGRGLNLARGQMKGIVATAPENQPAPLDREGYSFTEENAFQRASDHPLSTFSIDVDAASYSNARRILNESRMPPADAVRLEEFINYFHYDYPEPQGEHPFSITTEVAACPWNGEHKLVRVGIKGQSIAKENLPPNNLVFLIDTSGSMMSPDKLPLLQKGLRLLVEQLRKEDRLAIVAYAGSAGVVLPPTSGARKEDILQALDGLQAGGSTAGGAGLQLAYKLAQDGFLKKGNNRVILATDGDFNVGVTSDGELTRLIEEKREHGVFLTVLGFGTGNYQDAKMEQLADKGNGNYAYIDDILEARKVLVKEMGATLLTIAKDVKIQVEFNPARVSSYKLLGYENRMLKAEDFNNDKKDAGELGAGGAVTALYEVVPAGVKDDALPTVDPLKYQAPASPAASGGKELLTVKFRYKKPAENVSRLIERPLADEDRAWSLASQDFKFAAAAAGFGMTLRGSKTKGDLTYEKVKTMAREGLGKDEDGYRAEMIRLIDKANLIR